VPSIFFQTITCAHVRKNMRIYTVFPFSTGLPTIFLPRLPLDNR